MARLDSDSSLRVYLREISRTDLLTPAEEVKLAGRIKRGDHVVLVAFGGGLTWASCVWKL